MDRAGQLNTRACAHTWVRGRAMSSAMRTHLPTTSGLWLRKFGPAEASIREDAGAASRLLFDGNVRPVHLNEVVQRAAYWAAVCPNRVRT